ncbi:hypothetical protein BO94DRAFT_380248 [Aspergillus sclerotioniger CBS 115572]|uniref:Uncharacterized protein n=1 Tax=Aspergillus sclerotioniger CBS 115572 TaxID=1450535 RepID=A0A317WZJ0_9EURO|nr:hypothetical protein BO94DRAFT_380248 [Aspergillus sclerotioniger CBS 115572]PWY91804.1 hypothetical protein BO94DRAFT_380248 [Aspergillus sclerotioniger CBS 115572]
MTLSSCLISTEMAEKSEVIPVDDIANNVEELKKLVEAKIKRNVVLDEKWTVGIDLKCVNPSVPALLIKKDSTWGAVRVDTSPVLNKVSGPGQSSGIFIIIIKPVPHLL